MNCMVPWITSEPRKIYLYSQGDYDGLNARLGTIDWDSLMCSKDIEENWNAYKNKYEELIKAFIPHKLVKAEQRMKLPWTRYKSVKKKSQI